MGSVVLSLCFLSNQVITIFHSLDTIRKYFTNVDLVGRTLMKKSNTSKKKPKVIKDIPIYRLIET